MEFDLTGLRFACVVVDMQRLFTSPDGPFENHGASELIAAINRLTAMMRERDVPVVHAVYVLAPDGSDAGLLRSHPVVRDGYFSVDSPWTAIDPAIVVDDSDYHVRRARPNAFYGGSLGRLQGELGFDAVVLAGLSVNNAISATARCAFERDLPAVIPKSCVGAAPWEGESATYFGILDQWTAQLVDDEAAFAALLRSY